MSEVEAAGTGLAGASAATRGREHEKAQHNKNRSFMMITFGD
jgi:hypothetical protein